MRVPILWQHKVLQFHFGLISAPYHPSMAMSFTRELTGLVEVAADGHSEVSGMGGLHIKHYLLCRRRQTLVILFLDKYS